MRRWTMLTWPLLLWYFGVALKVLAENTLTDVRLTLSLNMDTLSGRPSIAHTFTNFELLNIHPTDNIFIHSIQTAPEETIMIRSASGEIAKMSWENIPQQLHVSRLPSGSLSLGPGQVAVVPVTFLPRFPVFERDIYVSPRASPAPPTISSAMRADFVDLLGDSVMTAFDKLKHSYAPGVFTPRRRSNLESIHPTVDEFEVNTSIVIDSSRGILQIPVTASSIRDNAYSIPDTIRFRHNKPIRDDESVQSSGSPLPQSSISSDGTVLLHAVPFHKAINNKISKRPSKNPDPIRDCYDLYMNNPSVDTDLEVGEVLVSRPDLMSVEFDPSRLLITPDLVMIPSQPSHVIREWSEEGPMYLPADSLENYIASVCTAPTGVNEDSIAAEYLNEMSNWIDTGNPDQSLGFVQIRTDVETLFISLERSPENQQRTESDGLASSFSGEIDSPAATISVSSTVADPSCSLLKASPERLDFRFISSKSPPLTTDISLQNKSPAPIRIMRVAVTIDGNQHRPVAGVVDYLGLRISVTQSRDHDTVDIPGTGLLERAITVSCSVSANPSSLPLKLTSFDFTGSIVIRGTMDTELQYDEWKKEIAGDPYRDIPLTLEIPYKVSVINGRVEVTFERSTHPYPQLYGAQGWDRYGRAISTLFFPLSRFDSTEGSESPLPTQRYRDSRLIGHDLRIMSNIEAPLTLDTAEVVDEYGQTIEDPESPCSRFNVSIVKPFDTGRNYPDFENLGFLSLQYKFDLRKERELMTPGQDDNEIVLPTKCFLNITTSLSETGIHQIPLVVFPAEVEILGVEKREVSSAANLAAQSSSGEISTILVGCNSIFSWARSSLVGQAFLEILTTNQEKQGQRTWRLYTKYLRGLVGLRDEDIWGIKPILVKVGAIEHGEVSKAPITFTNYNPIPMRISIDVGKVEGMAIELSKGGVHGHGTTIFDFLPNVDSEYLNIEDAVLRNGSLKGHSVYGLRQFLLSNRQALRFSRRINQREAISMHKGAVEKYPLLESLYHWHSYARFHRGKEDDGSFGPLGFCGLKFHAPSKQSHGSVPLMISADRKLVHRLKSCTTGATQASLSRNIMIPPGGVARFEITIESPPADYLESDISQLLATGLVLSTSFGQVMPIFVTFEAFQGQLIVWSSESSSGVTKRSSNASRIQDESMRLSVPLRLNWCPPTSFNNSENYNSAYAVTSKGGRGDSIGIPLQISSSFHRPVRLIDIASCNPWFQVSLKNTSSPIDINTLQGTFVGEVHSAALCTSEEGGSTFFPSFYECVLNWLANMHQLQPPGCGAATSHPSDENSYHGVGASSRGLREITRAIQSAKEDSKQRFFEQDQLVPALARDAAIERAFSLERKGTDAIKSGKPRAVGYVDISSLTTYAVAWDALEKASATGLTRLSSGLRATIEYDPNKPEATNARGFADYQGLALSMPGVEIQSTLWTPKLFAQRVGEDSTSGRKASVLQFPATVVGSVVALKVPLRNPTPVPVRVRLAVASLPIDKDKPSSSKSLQDRFMQSLHPPHVQDGVEQSSEESMGHHLWWEGGGGFFLADESGDVIRSHHNISIRAGAGAQFNLINPSLHSISAFVVGCGARCGMRGENKKNEKEFDMRHHSAIGAAAATSTTLTGRYRSVLPQNNEGSNDEPFIFAGGNPTPGSAGPQAFAIPFSGLDEIILPPYGVGYLGPIFFRPPGRSRVIGCDLARASGSRYWSVGSRDLCETEEFSSMVFLENSLTGLERIELRGKGQVERLFFLDPPSSDGTGGIEMRSGRSMLVFPGNGESVDKEVLPVTKEILLHNGGDVGVVVRSVFLSDTGRNSLDVLETKKKFHRLCQVGTFRLLDCHVPSRPFFYIDGRFMEISDGGFELSPGESRSLVVEHHADCKQKEAYISINVDYVTSMVKSKGVNSDGPYSSLAPSQSRGGMITQKRAEIIVGYAMDSLAFGDCTAVTGVIDRLNVTGKMTRTKRNVYSNQASCILLQVLEARRNVVERALPKSRTTGIAESRSSSEKKRPSQRSIWNATFRCLARADPSSSELQTLGREQIRHVVAGRYRAKGGLPPMSLSNTGFLVRERLGGGPPGGIGRQSGKGSGGGSDRVRTLSDALFPAFSPEHQYSVYCLIPAGLGWRVAFARSIINEKSIQESPFAREADGLPGSSNTTLEFHGISDLQLLDGNSTCSRQGQGSVDSVPQSRKKSSARLEEKKDLFLEASSLPHVDDDERASEEWITKESKKQFDKAQREPRHREDNRNGKAPTSSRTAIETLPSKSPRTSVHDSGPRISPSKQGAKKDRTEQKASGKVTNAIDRDVPASPLLRKEHFKKGPKASRKGEDFPPRQELLQPTTQESDDKSSYHMNSRDNDWKERAESQRGVGKIKEKSRQGKRGEAEAAGRPHQPFIIPPPGLAPPPGFDQASPIVTNTPPNDSDVGGADPNSLGNMLNVALTSDVNFAGASIVSPSLSFSRDSGTPRTDLVFGSSLLETPSSALRAGENANFTFQIQPSVAMAENPTPKETAQPPVPTEDMHAPADDHLLDVLLQNQDGTRIEFDVMDFLDSILDDVGSSDEHRVTTVSPSLIAASAEVPLTSNPWASAKRSSRAAAYGINVDESEGGDESSSGPFPLLTPMAILMAGHREEDGDEDDRAFSFYARLTDDEE